MAQGFYLARPLTVENATKLLREAGSEVVRFPAAA
jgi:hypothetical protein